MDPRPREHQLKGKEMDEVYFREFYRMQNEINERDSRIAELEERNSNLLDELKAAKAAADRNYGFYDSVAEELIEKNDKIAELEDKVNELEDQNRHLDEEAMLYRSNFQARDRRVHDLNSVIDELRTELSNEEWINEQSRKEIDRLNEQIRGSFLSSDSSDEASIVIKQVEHHIEDDEGWGDPLHLRSHTFDILADVTVGGQVYTDVKLDWLNSALGNLHRSNLGQSEALAELRLDLGKARAEIHRLNGLLDKREESAYTAMKEREKAEEFCNELAELNADYEQLMTYYTSQRSSNRHMEAHIESLKEDLSTVEVNYEAVKSAYRDSSIANRELRRDLLAAQEQRDDIQRKHDELVTQLEELVEENDEY